MDIEKFWLIINDFFKKKNDYFYNNVKVLNYCYMNDIDFNIMLIDTNNNVIEKNKHNEDYFDEIKMFFLDSEIHFEQNITFDFENRDIVEKHLLKKQKQINDNNSEISM